MRVKAGDHWFEVGPGHPLMVELTEADKTNIANMAPSATRYAMFDDADATTAAEKLAWMAAPEVPGTMRPTEADKAALQHLEPVDPTYLRQSGEPMSEAEQTAWFQAAREEGLAEGATHFRYSVHPDISNLRLVEGWPDRPANEGDARWQLQAG